jgi:hypothetical protein
VIDRPSRDFSSEEDTGQEKSKEQNYIVNGELGMQDMLCAPRPGPLTAALLQCRIHEKNAALLQFTI